MSPGRRTLSAMMAVLMPVGALSALFAHAHLDDHDTSHHHGHTVHSHFSGHHDLERQHRSPVTIDHDDDEQTLTFQLFTAVSPHVKPAPALPETPVLPAETWSPSPRPMRQVTHGHDPPAFDPLAPRPPPSPSPDVS